VGIACTTWSPAQDEDALTKKKTVSKEARESRAKVAEAKRAAQAKAKARADALAKATDLNHASQDELKKLPGITDAYAAAIIAKRPYKSKAELVTKNVLPMGIYQAIHQQVAAK
jgi:DNA uptake protein ComE-like DNA-binding protein